MISVQIDGVEKLLRKFNSIQKIHEILAPPMRISTMVLQADLAKYPPKRRGSKYVRTGTLGRKWTTSPPRLEGRKLIGRVGTNVAYAPLVQSSKFQSSVHRGRWQTDEQVIKRNRKRIVTQLNITIARALED